MPFDESSIKVVIITALFKVLRMKAPLKWDDLKGKEMHLMFDTLSEPNGWPSFFAEAVATTLQNEIIRRSGFVPDLEDEFVKRSLSTAHDKWIDLYVFIKNNVKQLASPDVG